MTPALWIAVGAIAVATYLTRALPFLLAERRRGGDRKPGPAPAWLDALGPCILAAMGAAILWPEAGKAAASGNLAQFLSGLAAAAAIMLWRRDAGLATLAGIAGYALAGWLT
ncbi:AzlD domain-containing protein [Paracoccus sphaerophysae]|uniref:AzlD domain-containing protein n=1 Tax=Paracoccus sphaerophysae TaxID=690417 RepID=UPI002356A6D1|nr:AzlD domain-containing protein [Paracoccus sphaerophysae]